MGERPHDGVARFEDRHRPANRGRLGRQHRVGEPAQIVIVVGIALRQGLDAHQPVLGLPAVDDLGRQALQRDRSRLQQRFQPVQRHLQRRDEDVLRLLTRRLIGVGELLQGIGQPARSDGARPLGIARGLAQAIHRTLERFDVFLIGRRRIDGIRVERGHQDL